MDMKQRIEQVIASRGLTKGAVAEKMGKQKQNINSLLTDPRWSIIEAVADAIGITPQELLFGSTQQQAQQPAQSSPGVFVCPNCGAGVSFGAFVVSKPAEKEGEQ